MQIAKSLVIDPDSIVSIQTASKSVENLASSLLLSNLARWARPRVQANIEAESECSNQFNVLFTFISANMRQANQ